MTPYLLALFGLLLIFLECCLPGMVLGICGAALIIFSLVLLSMQTTALLFLIQAIALCACVVFVIMGALRVIRGTAKQGSLYLESDQQGFIASTFDASQVGKKGVAMTDLRPSGHVLIDGKLLQAVSDSSYIERGKQIRVLKGQGAVLIVEECQTEEKGKE